MITAMELKREMSRRGFDKKAVVVDVRTQEEFNARSMPGTVNIPLGDIISNNHDVFERLSSYDKIYLLCRTDNRSTFAKDHLDSLGLTHTEVVSGGITNWKKED